PPRAEFLLGGKPTYIAKLGNAYTGQPPTKSVLYAALGLPPRGDPLDSLIPPKALVVVDVARRRIDGRRLPAARARSDQQRGCSTSARPTRSLAVSSPLCLLGGSPRHLA